MCRAPRCASGTRACVATVPPETRLEGSQQPGGQPRQSAPPLCRRRAAREATGRPDRRQRASPRLAGGALRRPRDSTSDPSGPAVRHPQIASSPDLVASARRAHGPPSGGRVSGRARFARRARLERRRAVGRRSRSAPRDIPGLSAHGRRRTRGRRAAAERGRRAPRRENRIVEPPTFGSTSVAATSPTVSFISSRPSTTAATNSAGSLSASMSLIQTNGRSSAAAHSVSRVVLPYPAGAVSNTRVAERVSRSRATSRGRRTRSARKPGAGCRATTRLARTNSEAEPDVGDSGDPGASRMAAGIRPLDAKAKPPLTGSISRNESRRCRSSCPACYDRAPRPGSGCSRSDDTGRSRLG